MGRRDDQLRRQIDCVDADNEGDDGAGQGRITCERRHGGDGESARRVNGAVRGRYLHESEDAEGRLFQPRWSEDVVREHAGAFRRTDDTEQTAAGDHASAGTRTEDRDADEYAGEYAADESRASRRPTGRHGEV